MALNWTIEVIIEIIVSVLVIITALLTYFEPRTKKVKCLFYIRLGLYFMAFYFIFDAISILTLNLVFARVYNFMIFPSVVFLTIGINYIVKETFFSTFLIIIFSMGVFFFYLAFLPNSVQITIEAGKSTTDITGLYELVSDLYTLLFAAIFFYWGLKIYLNAPFLIKKEALIFLIGSIIISPLTLGGYMFYYIFPNLELLFVLISDILLAVGSLIIIISIMIEPKLLYILPFTLYRILVKDRKGFPLFDHDWSLSQIPENIFTGFINAVQLMSQEVMHMGGLLDINLQEGILIVHESKNTTVGLVSSKSSKLLRESLINFTLDFEKMFEKELKESNTDMKKYESAYELIEKYFSNFPYKIIKSKKQAILLAAKYTKIPLVLENNLKQIFTTEKEYEDIKKELLKSPISMYSDFLKLYDELKDEIDKIEGKKSQLLESNSEEE